ncbi:MAG TPA: hypothetical protein VFZ53_23245 [Polyangiaceae bacterium]
MRRERGISLGCLGILFMLATPIGLLVAWWHPLFREGKKRDPLLVLAALVYASILAGTIALSLFEE